MIRASLRAAALALALLLPWAACAQDAHLAAMQNVLKLVSAKEYAQAEAAARQWVADSVSRRGENHEHTSDALQQLAFVLEVQNRGADAEPLRRRVLAIQEKLLGADHLNAAGAATFLAMNLQRQGRKDEAQALFARAQAAREKALGKTAPEALANITGVELQVQGRHSEAEALYRKQLARMASSLGAGHADLAFPMLSIAATLLAQDKVDDADRLMTEALALIGRTGRLGALKVQALGLARAQAKRGNAARALALYGAALEGIDRFFADSAGWDEDERQRAAEQVAPVLNEVIEYLLRLHQADPKAGHDRAIVAVASRGQSRIFSELMRRADVTRYSRDPKFAPAKARRDALLRQSTELARQRQALAMSGGDGAALARRADAVDRDLAAAEDALWKGYPRYMELAQPRPVGADDVQQKLLRPGEALLLFALLPERALVFAFTRDRHAMHVAPLKRVELAQRVEAVRRPMEQVGAGAPLATLRRVDPAVLHALHRDLVAPVEGVLRGAQRVVVVAEGALNTLPLEMLVARYDPADRAALEAERAVQEKDRARSLLGEYAKLAWLGGSFRFTYAPSLAAIASQRSGAAAPRAWELQLVSFADPVFGPEQGGAGGASAATRSALGAIAKARGGAPAIPRLKETAEEAKEIAEALGGRSAIYLRADAQERTVKSAALGRARYVHFATHGFLGGEFVEVQEARGATRGGGVSPQPALALTMVGDLKGEDGLLTMKEVIEDMELGAELVALSACNTAGENAAALAGEGFAGMTRAFMYAGARGLWVSHWSVESASARALVVGAFRELKAGKPAVEALVASRQKLAATEASFGGTRASLAHPFFWAPFVHVGD